jgi:hypothetical protein
MSILVGLYIAGVVAKQGDKWQVQISTYGSVKVGHVVLHFLRIRGASFFEDIWRMHK